MGYQNGSYNGGVASLEQVSSTQFCRNDLEAAMSDVGVAVADSGASVTALREKSDLPDPVAKLKSAAGLLLGAFGSVLTVIGINSSEASSILRNDEWKVLLVLLFLLLSIVLAFLSAVVGTRARWSIKGIVGGLILIASGYAAVIMALPLDQQNSWSNARNAARWIALGLLVFALTFINWSIWEWNKHRQDTKRDIKAARAYRKEATDKKVAKGRAQIDLNDASAALDKLRTAPRLDDEQDLGGDVALATEVITTAERGVQNAEIEAENAETIVQAKEAKIRPFGVDLQPWLIVFSGLLLGLAVLGAIRIEARNQQDDAVQVTPSVASPDGNYDVVTVTVAAPRLSIRQQVVFTMIGVKPNGHTRPIETVRVRPDATGLAKQTFTVPVSLLQF
jgi:hypothetical protein